MVDRPSSTGGIGWFEVPANAFARHPNVILAPRELKRWMDTLPMANPSRSADMLQSQLQMLVTDPDPGGRFGALLNLFDKPIGDLLEIAEERQAHQADAAEPPGLLEGCLLGAMSALADGHLRLANHKLTLDKPPELENLGRAMVAIDHQLRIAHQHYHKVSDAIWCRVLALLRHAEHWQLAEAQIEAPLLHNTGPRTIQALAIRALIIGLCDPNHHRPGEVAEWYRWIGSHCGTLTLSPLPQGNAAISLDMSGRMGPLAAARRGKPDGDTRYLATDGLFDALRNDDEPPRGLAQALENLLKGRRSPEQRRANRQPRHQPYCLAHGIRNMHRRLTELIEGGRGKASDAQIISCVQRDQSRRGAAFTLDTTPNPPLAVGEPVLAEACSDTPGAAKGFAAQIRRLKIDDGNRIEMGVEKLAGRFIPVTFSGAAVDRARGANQALLQHQAEKGHFTLIAPHSVYREGDVITVQGPGVQYRLRLCRVLQSVRNTAFIEVEAA